jgi:hypothetical protein
MEDTYRVAPHILRQTLDSEREAVVKVSVDGHRALLVFRTADSAGGFTAHTLGTFSDSEAVPVSLADISEVCAKHGLVLVALYGMLEPEDSNILSVEVVPEVFGRGRYGRRVMEPIIERRGAGRNDYKTCGLRGRALGTVPPHTRGLYSRLSSHKR